MSIGETLANARQQAGLTVTDVSLRTRIRETVIHGIERDDFSLCGGDFYARGHIRNIARVVGVDPEALVQEYNEKYGAGPEPMRPSDVFGPETPVDLREPRRPNWSAAMAAALVVVIVYGIVRLLAGGFGHAHHRPQMAARPVATRSAASPSSPVATPSPAKSDDTLALGPDQVAVRLTADRASWVSVRDGQGHLLFEGLVHGGKTVQWTASKQIKLIVGNAGAVRLNVNGKDIGVPGNIGEVVRLNFGPGDPTAG